MKEFDKDEYIERGGLYVKDGCIWYGGIKHVPVRTCHDALPEKHGEPIEGYWECSECGCEIGGDCDAPKYCPGCGAKVVER